MSEVLCFHCGTNGTGVCPCLLCAPDAMLIGPCQACLGRKRSEKRNAWLDREGIDVSDVAEWAFIKQEAPARSYRRLAGFVE